MAGFALEGLGRLIRRRFGSRSTLIAGLLELAEGFSSDSAHDAKLQCICDAARRLLNCDRSSLFIMADGDFVGSFNAGNPPEIEQVFFTHRVPVHDPLVAEAFASRSYVISNHAESDPRMHRGVRRKAAIRAIVVAPLFDLDDNPLGFLTAEFNQSVGGFSDTESQILMGMAELAEIVLRNCELVQTQSRLSQHIMRTSRLETLGRLSAGVAHDLNNRLTVLLGGLELLEKQQTADVAQLLVSARAASRMSRQLLQFGNSTESRQNRDCFVPAVIQGIEHELKLAIVSRCALLVEDLQPVQVQISADQLEQIVSNLVINAADASQPGDYVVVRDFIDDGAHAWTITVADSGEGMTEAVQENLFEPFVSTKPDGSGLGLASVKTILDSVGGEISFASETGVGTRFEVSIPLADAHPDLDVVVADSLPEVSVVMPGTIFVVDDDDPVRKHIADQLAGEGHTVLSFAAAVDAMKSLKIAPDMVITDIVMPDQDGFAFSRELRAQFPELPLLLISGYYPQILDANIPGDGPVRFMSKPFSVRELQSHVSGLLANRATLDMSAD